MPEATQERRSTAESVGTTRVGSAGRSASRERRRERWSGEIIGAEKQKAGTCRSMARVPFDGRYALGRRVKELVAVFTTVWVPMPTIRLRPPRSGEPPKPPR